MKKMSFSALTAAATVLAQPFRNLLSPRAPQMLNLPTTDLSKIDLSKFEVAAEPATRAGHIVIPGAPRALLGATVRADGSDPKTLIVALNKAFEEFKASNEEKLKAKVDDAVVTERLTKIDATLVDLEKALDDAAKLAAAAKLHGGGGQREVPDAAYSTLFGSFMREGTREQEDKLKAEQKVGVRAAMSEGSPADGGLTAPIEWDRTVAGRLKLISGIRAEATVQSISKAGFIKLFTDRSVGSGWVGETASRPATSTPQFTALPFVPGEIYANAAASQDLLDDSEVNMETWLTGEIETEFARQEGLAFISGDGTNKPFGLLGYITGGAAAARHPWGAIEAVKSGAAAAFTTDGVVDLVYKLPAMYTPNAKFFLNRTSLGSVRKLKDGQGNYIWQPTYTAGQPSTLMGYSVVDLPDMPALAAGATPLLFGDMRETYLVVDRIGFRVLRDPYTNKPYICFYCTKRVGGGVKNPDAMKAQLISA
jgi:HK97 family phage major capsid protein